MKEKKEMQYNFDMMMTRVIDSMNKTDLEKANTILKNIRKNCICVGTGGSSIVSLYASILLAEANKIMTFDKEPRDLLYMNLDLNYEFLVAFTYGNKNYGINMALQKAKDNQLSTHVVTANTDNEQDICYQGEMPAERSFISLAATIISMSILLNYYLQTNKEQTLNLIEDIYLSASEKETNFELKQPMPVFEIMTGDNTYVANRVLETTITEGGLGTPVSHEKYSYCHGRSTLSYHLENSNLIYLINGKPKAIDHFLLSNVEDLYENIIILHSNKKDKIIGEFDLAFQSLMLCKKIAEKQNKDLSRVDYAPVVKKLYKYEKGL